MILGVYIKLGDGYAKFNLKSHSLAQSVRMGAIFALP